MLEVKAPEVKLVDHLQRDQHILLHRRGVLLALDLSHLRLAGVHPPTHAGGVEGLGPDGEIGGVEGQRFMDLEPGNAERHHHVGHRMGFGEEIFDLLAGADVPLRHPRGDHFLLRTVGQAPALPHRLHDLEGTLFRHAAGDQEEHDIVAAADGLADRDPLIHDQILGVAQPHVGPMGKAGQPDQDIEFAGLGIHQHAPDEGSTELRDGHRAGGAQNRVVHKAQHFGGGEDAHGPRVVQGDLLGVYPGQILEHADHGGVVVSQHIQL